MLLNSYFFLNLNKRSSKIIHISLQDLYRTPTKLTNESCASYKLYAKTRCGGKTYKPTCTHNKLIDRPIARVVACFRRFIFFFPLHKTHIGLSCFIWSSNFRRRRRRIFGPKQHPTKTSIPSQPKFHANIFTHYNNMISTLGTCSHKTTKKAIHKIDFFKKKKKKIACGRPGFTPCGINSYKEYNCAHASAFRLRVET